MSSAFTIGRFQPFHRDHKKLIQMMMEKFDRIYVGINTLSGSYLNPFTFEERAEMIQHSLGLPVFPVHNTKNLGKLKENICRYVPSNSVFCTRTRINAIFYRILGFEVQYWKRDGISSSYLRSLIFNDDEKWKSYVDKEIVQIIERVEVKKRINLFKEDFKKYRHFPLLRKYQIFPFTKIIAGEEK